MHRSLDLNLLSTLHVLIEERHVSRAARRLNLTQSAVSHALRRLRTHFGDPLLVRRGAVMVPTPRALELEGPLRRLLAELERLTAPAEFEPATARGTLHVATTDYGLSVLLPHVLERLTKTAPAISIAYHNFSEDLFEHLKTGVLDIVLTGQESYRDMRTERLFDERFVFMTRADHPLVGAALDLDAFLTWPHVLVDVIHSRLFAIDRKLEQRGKSRRIVLRVPHLLSAAFFAQTSDLIVPVPERVAGLFAKAMDLAIHEPPSEIDIGRFDYVQMWHERRDNDPLHRWFRSLVRRAARDVRAP